MENNTIASQPKSKYPFYYGWVIVFIAAMSMFFSGPGQTYSISVFIDSYIKDFSWSRSTVSSMYSIATLSAGLLLFIVGRSIDKYGQKKANITIAVLLGVACVWNSFVAGPVMLFIGFFMLRLFGQGSMTLIPSTLVPQWFARKRATALSIMSLGGVAGSAILPPLNTWIIDTWGWSMAWRVWAVLLWAVFTPLAVIFIRNKPEDIGLSLRNELGSKSEAISYDENKWDVQSWTLAQAIRTRTYWFMLFAQAIPSMIATGLTFHLVSIMGEKGITHMFTSYVLSISAIMAFGMTLISGWILDRVKVHYVMAISFFLEIISMILLVMVNSTQMAVLFGVFHGIVMGAFGVCGGVLWPNYFGREHLGSIRSVAVTAIVIGSAFGPIPFGYAFDMLGGYTEILLTMIIFPALALLAALFSPPPSLK